MSPLDLAWVAVLLGVLVSLLWATSRPPLVARAGPEARRKLVHLAMASAAALLPAVFDSVVPIAVLSALGVGLFLVIRAAPTWDRKLGSILRPSGRATVGDLAFAAAIPVCYVASDGHPAIHAAAMLILGVADSAAALIGQGLGRTRFTRIGAGKSPVGSLAFLLVALGVLACMGPLAGTGVESVAVDVLLATALVSTAVELCLPYGLDNLGIPLASAWILGGVAPASGAGCVAALVLALSALHVARCPSPQAETA